jgi:hypothetical protein
MQQRYALCAALLLVAGLVFAGRAHAQVSGYDLVFPPSSRYLLEGTFPTGYYRGAGIWGDVNNDGLLDQAVTGLVPEASGSIVRQDRRALETQVRQFTYLCPPLDPCTFRSTQRSVGPGVIYGDLAWADYDRDGDLDFALAGATAQAPPYAPIARLYRNDGRGRFEPIDASLEGVYGAALAWGDADSDGDPDLVITGLNADDEPRTRLYRNDDGTLVPSGVVLPDLGFGDASWADADGDGDADLVLMGVSPDTDVQTTYLRNDDGVLTEAAADLPNVAFGTIDWSDVDADGDLDLLLSGTQFGIFLTNQVTALMRNDGGRFTEVDAGLPDLFYTRTAWGDHNADGWADLFASGFFNTVGGTTTRFFTNEAGEGFTPGVPVSGYTPMAVEHGDVQTFDFDGNGDTDFAVAGAVPDPSGVLDDVLVLQLYLRQFELPPDNTPPKAPTNLRSRREGEAVIFSWDAAVDTTEAGILGTPATGLTYALRVGTAPGTIDVVAPLADPISGRRRVSGRGNVGSSRQWVIRGLDDDRLYYWSVQAIDASLAASPFAADQVVAAGDPDDRTPPDPPTDLVAVAGDGVVTLSWTSSPADDLANYFIYRDRTSPATTALRTVEQDVTTYVDSTVVNDSTYYYRVQAADRSGNRSAFSNEVAARPAPPLMPFSAGLPRLGTGDIAWGDYDGDGDHDLFLLGQGNGGFRAALYRNDGQSEPLRWAFTNVQPILGVRDGDAAWGDYDGDGDLDLAVAGEGSLSATRIFRNDPDTLTLVTDRLPGGEHASLDWGDADGDGDLDLALLVGQPDAPATLLIRNEDGAFQREDVGWRPAARGTLAWADYDTDGDLDLALIGEDEAGTVFTDLYRNDVGAFTRVEAGLLGLARGTLAWGDYDADGDADLVVSGLGRDGPETLLYRNEGDDAFQRLDPDILATPNGTLAWGDYNNDGDLDLLVASNGRSAIYLKDGPSFIDSGVGLPSAPARAAAWGHLDLGNVLDFVLVGEVATAVYRTNVPPGNDPPRAPTNLRSQRDGDAVTFAWDAATDAQTPQAGLTYTLRVGTAPGGTDVVAPMSLPGGRRLVPQPGNAGYGTRWTLRGLPEGTYYWSVQAVDASFVGSPFADEASVTVPSKRDAAPFTGER